MRDLMGLLVKKCSDWTPPKKRSSGQGKVAADVGRVIDSTESDRLLDLLYRRFGAVHITDQAVFQSNLPFASAMAIFLLLVSLALVGLSMLLGQKETN
jgi:hypothetical protein